MFTGLKINQQHTYRQTPEYARESQLDKEAKEIYYALKKEGRLSYNLDDKRVDLRLQGWTFNGLHNDHHCGDKLEINFGGEIIFRSMLCRNGWSLRASEYPEGRARKLEEVELKTTDGSRTYALEEIPHREKFEKQYEILLEQIYKEKLRIDQEASNRLNFLSERDGGKR